MEVGNISRKYIKSHKVAMLYLETKLFHSFIIIIVFNHNLANSQVDRCCLEQNDIQITYSCTKWCFLGYPTIEAVSKDSFSKRYFLPIKKLDFYKFITEMFFISFSCRYYRTETHTIYFNESETIQYMQIFINFLFLK